MTRGGRKDDSEGPERKCIVSGEVGPKAGLVRFVAERLDRGRIGVDDFLAVLADRIGSSHARQEVGSRLAYAFGC